MFCLKFSIGSAPFWNPNPKKKPNLFKSLSLTPPHLRPCLSRNFSHLQLACFLSQFTKSQPFVSYDETYNQGVEDGKGILVSFVSSGSSHLLHPVRPAPQMRIRLYGVGRDADSQTRYVGSAVWLWHHFRIGGDVDAVHRVEVPSVVAGDEPRRWLRWNKLTRQWTVCKWRWRSLGGVMVI